VDGGGIDKKWVLTRVMILVPLLLSLTVHEWAHAYCAYRLGDDTAKRQGRLTLSPLAHIDPIGTLLLPMLGIPFGWAKPVPVNPIRFRRSISMRRGMMLTAAAGPFSNLLITLACAVVYGLLARFRPDLLGRYGAVPALLHTAIGMNLALAMFNMLPIPPLDGSRVVDGLLPVRLQHLWERWVRIAPYALLGVIVMPYFLHFSVLSWPMEKASMLVWKLMWVVAGV
jgi:Zn-dependent protease